jgi:hypothetical protein
LVKLDRVVEVPLSELGAIWQAILERRLDIRDSIWQLELTVPAGATVTATLKVPDDWVFFELGYEFEVDKLDVLKFTHWHDGREIVRDIMLSESVLSFRYTRPELCLKSFTVQITNIDSLNDHKVRTLGLYKAVPRDLVWMVGLK